MNRLWHEIKEAIEGHGHSCTCDDCMEENHDHHHHGFDWIMVWRLLIAAVFFIGGMVFEDRQETVSLILFVIAVLVAGYDIFISAVANLFNRKLFDETLLMSIVAIAAIAIGEAEEGASVMILFQLGELFQGFAVAKVRENIEGLMENRSSETADVLADVRSNKTEKGHTEEFITKFCRIYTPVVLGIALLVAVMLPLAFHQSVMDGIYKALVITVIACPCAIVISVPLSYFAGIGGATRLGILFKNTGAMDAVSRTLSVIFEKSNVLEDETVQVTSVKSEKLEADIFLRIAAHACAYSNSRHAQSIKSSYGGTIYIELIESFLESENGISVRVNNVDILLGNVQLLSENGITIPTEDASDDALFLAIDKEYSGRIQFSVCVKPDVADAITVLSWDKNKELALISDDSPAATERFARQIGIEQYYAGCKQADKIAIVREMQTRCQKGTLLFVGDPVNDADCLKAADIGIALNGAGSDAAIRAADVVIMDDAPSKIVTAIEAARHTHSIVWQNIYFALCFKVVILVLDVIFGVCPLWLAVFADVGVALLAVLNSLRAFRIRTKKI